MFFFHFLTKAGSFQDSIAAIISGAPKDLKTTYFLFLALSLLYRFCSVIGVRQ